MGKRKESSNNGKALSILGKVPSTVDRRMIPLLLPDQRTATETIHILDRFRKPITQWIDASRRYQKGHEARLRCKGYCPRALAPRPAGGACLIKGLVISGACR